jgi:hypothetical protein
MKMQLGSCAGCFLAQHGVSTIVLDKAPGPARHPQAHYINNRTMELFRLMKMPRKGSTTALGLHGHRDWSLAADVTSLSPPLREWRSFKYVDKLISGQLFGEKDHFPGQKQSSFLPLAAVTTAQ